MIMKRKFRRIVLVVIMTILTAIFPVSSTLAASQTSRVDCLNGAPTGSSMTMFSNNNILFYNPCDNGCGGQSSSGGVVTVLEGNNNAERIWNWFASAGIAGVSDDAAVIAGIMGNLQAESGFNPFAVNSGGCSGLYQGCGNRRYTLREAFRNAGIDESVWGRSLNSVPEEVNNTAIDVTLTHLTTSDDGSFRTFVNQLNVVNEKTPEAYSDLFLVVVERAVGGESPILDSGVKTLPQYSGGDYQAASTRRGYANNIYNQYSGNLSGSGSVTRLRSDTQSVVCNNSDGYLGSGQLVSGGMTLEEARRFMEPYRAISPRNYHEPGSYLNRWHINDVNGCASDLENCVAFTQYFICEYAHVCMGLPNGGQVVDTLLNSGRGFINGGTTPRPYAIFSSATHTGVVLGIDAERGRIIIGEAGCGSNIGYDWTNAHDRPLSEWTNGTRKYAYTDNLIGL